MTRLFIEKNNVYKEHCTLTETDYHHLKTVRRLKEGAALEIVSDNKLLRVKLRTIKDQTLYFTLLSTKDIPKQNYPKLTLVQGLPKQDKMGEVLRKCTELGINHFIPIETERSISTAKKSQEKEKRWQKIIESAAIQSQRSQIPSLSPITTIDELVSSKSKSKKCLKLVAWEETKKLSIKKILLDQQNCEEIMIVIGPEGGFSEKEINILKKETFIPVSLGSGILRTENAGFFACGAVLYCYEL